MGRYHFIAIGGIGMSGLAKYLLEDGHTVSGSDIADSKYVDKLIELGATVFIGHDAKNVPDDAIIIKSSAIRDNNPEVIRAKELGLKIYHRSDLLEEIAKLDDYTKHRVRFMTSHPKDLSPDVVDIIAGSKSICNNIHLPIQSGSDKILKLMNRRYTREYYLKVVDDIRSKIPDCGITTDIMVGFPYEEDKDFEDTLDIVKRVEFSTAFTFVYSVRRGTVAAKMPQVPASVSKERIMKLIEVQNEITAKLSKGYENKTFEVLCEDVNDKLDGYVMGRTDSGRLVNFEGDSSMVGKFVNVKVVKSKSAVLYGKVEE